MKRLSSHGKFLTLSAALLLAPAAIAVLTGCGLLAESRSSAGDAFDRVVPGMTRADDLAALGFDLHEARLVDSSALGHIKGRAADACLAADRFCTGYVFAGRSGQVVLLVMDGRVIDKGFTPA